MNIRLVKIWTNTCEVISLKRIFRIFFIIFSEIYSLWIWALGVWDNFWGGYHLWKAPPFFLFCWVLQSLNTIQVSSHCLQIQTSVRRVMQLYLRRNVWCFCFIMVFLKCKYEKCILNYETKQDIWQKCLYRTVPRLSQHWRLKHIFQMIPL